MFDLGWAEMLVIAVVLIVVVGPKDLPAMLRSFGRTTRQLRSMAGDFRRQFDDALKEAELDEVRSTAQEMRKLDPRKDIRAAMNPMKAVGDEIRSSLEAAGKMSDPTPAKQNAGLKPMEGPEASATAPLANESRAGAPVSQDAIAESPATVTDGEPRSARDKP